MPGRDTHFLADAADHAAQFLLSLPNAALVPLAGKRPTIDGQRLSPRLQFLANGGKRGLAATSEHPTAMQLKLFELSGRWLALWQARSFAWCRFGQPSSRTQPTPPGLMR